MEKPPPRSAVVVNENTAQLRLAALVLEKEGLSVTGFGSAEEALGHMDPDAPPNVIITDLHMPGLDGWRLCRLLRSPEYPTFNQTPILVLSATFSGDDVSEITTQLGANAFLSIPYQPDQLRSHVRDLLAGRTPQAKKRVLIVEDSHTLANLLEKSFVDYGYDVQTAYTGEEARRAFSTYAPDIVILDYFLPDTTGDTLLPLFKKPGSRTVVIIETVDVDPERALRLLHSGADAYVRKPFEPAFLIDQCENALRARSLMRSEELLETRTAELRRSEERFRSYFELPLVGSAVLSTDMNWIEVNSWLCRYLGYARGELKRLSWTEVTHPDDRDAEREQIDRLLSAKAEAYSMEQRFVRKDDGVVFANVSVGLVRSEDGTPEFFVALVQDISERKRAEEKLRLLSSAVEQSTEGLAITDLEGNITYANKTIAQLHGYASDEVIGKHVRDLFPPQSCQIIEDGLRTVFASGEVLSREEEIELLGKRLCLHTHLTPIRDESGQVSAVLGVCRDITARRRAEEAVRASEASYRTIFNSVSDAIFVHHPHTGAIVDVNERVRDLCGYEPQELKGCPAGVLSLGEPPYDQDHAVELVRRAADGEPQLFEWHARRKDGRPIWVEVALRPVTLNDQPRVLAVVRDITERKRAEEALRLSEQRYRITLDSLNEAIHVVDPGLRIVLCNKVFRNWCRRLGLPTEPRGRTVMEMFPFLPERVREEYERVLATGESITTEERNKVGGQELITLTSKVPIKQGGRVVGVITVVHDMTEERRLRDEMLQAQRLEALNLVAGSIAHDFNNLLAGVLTNLEAAKGKPAEAGELLDAALAAARRAAALARRLLPFSNGWKLHRQQLRLEPLLSETAHVALAGSATHCECRFPDDLWPVLGDPDHLGQVFQNLLINARQAMGEAGTVEVVARNIEIPPGAPIPIPAGRYVRVEVRDHGVGIPPQDLPHIFEHYFTTRKGGTGLGLAGAYQIVKKHGGHIEVESQVGVGTTFRVYLPTPQQTPAPGPVVAEGAQPYGRLRILIVDDEEIILRGARRLLEARATWSSARPREPRPSPCSRRPGSAASRSTWWCST